MKLQRGITKSSKKGGITGRGEWVFDPLDPSLENLQRALPLIFLGWVGWEMKCISFFGIRPIFRGFFFALSFKEWFEECFFLASHLFLPCHKQMPDAAVQYGQHVQTSSGKFTPQIRRGGADLWAGATNQFRCNLGRKRVKAAVLWGRFQESLPPVGKGLGR